ncbi:hypothetical protein AVEN_152072-1 [Araneus ventricosus]|uniref:Uncharacterized protein n=1 Tax=Araneus ventricosus TaxID=182803 RepID=A0A4Y2V376_ARAVE|nr:hypothetical protein AVEN_152072-1 [Araneus ventricosus]
MKVYSQLCRKTRSTGNRETIDLAQISKVNRQQSGNNSSALCDLATQTVSKSLINDNNRIFSSAQLTRFLVRTADETPKKFQSINTLPDPRPALILSDGRDVTWSFLVH